MSSNPDGSKLTLVEQYRSKLRSSSRSPKQDVHKIKQTTSTSEEEIQTDGSEGDSLKLKGEDEVIRERKKKKDGVKSENRELDIDEIDGVGGRRSTQHKIGEIHKKFEEVSKAKHVRSKESTGRNSIYLQIVTCTLFIISLIIFLNQTFQSLLGKNHVNSRTDAVVLPRPVSYREGNLSIELENIQQRYSNSDLDENFWERISASSWSHMQEGQIIKQPVVLMLVGHQSSSHLDKVASDIASMFSKVFTLSEEGIAHIRGSEQAGKDTGQAKLDMDNILQEEFNSGRKVALVSQFDMLPACSIMLFHSYCDNDYAPYKDAVIIFTIKIQNNVPEEGDAKHKEEMVQEYLGQLWSKCPEELSENKIFAMHSRVSNNIAFVL